MAPHTRRTFLVSLAAGFLAACAPAPSAPAPTAAPPTTPPAPKPAASPLASPAASPAASPSASPAASPAASPVASPSPAAVTILKPTPEAAFIRFGSNAEMRYDALDRNTYLVPAANFFVRDHASTPTIDEKTWQLRIEGPGVAQPYTLSYDELRNLPSRTITRYVECAGNGRALFNEVLQRPAQGTQWHLGAYGVAEWTGVPLADLLDRAGVKPSAVDVVASGLDVAGVRRPVPLDKAREEDTLVVYQMNGQPLLPDHGFPARLLAPGWVGVANIKWLGSLEVTEETAYTDWNTQTYVLIGPDYQPEPPARGPIVNEQVMKSALALAWPGSLTAGSQTVWGYAWSPSGKIARVDVSVDGGPFQPATLVEPNIERAGVRWQFSFDATPGSITITPRASDDQGNVQPTDPSAQPWNEQGYVFGLAAPHPVTVTA